MARQLRLELRLVEAVEELALVDETASRAQASRQLLVAHVNLRAVLEDVNRLVVAARADEQVGESEPDFQRIGRPLQRFARAGDRRLLRGRGARALFPLLMRTGDAGADQHANYDSERSQDHDAGSYW